MKSRGSTLFWFILGISVLFAVVIMSVTLDGYVKISSALDHALHSVDNSLCALIDPNTDQRITSLEYPISASGSPWFRFLIQVIGDLELRAALIHKPDLSILKECHASDADILTKPTSHSEMLLETPEHPMAAVTFDIESLGVRIIAFRGTLFANEWNLDLQLGHADVLNEQTNDDSHAGFHEMWDNLRPVIEPYVNSRAHRSVWLAGHSLGAGVASIAATYLDGITGLFLVGSPRVGAPSFTRLVESRVPHIVNICNDSDLVTDLPWAVTPNTKNAKKPFIYSHVAPVTTVHFNYGSASKNHLLTGYHRATYSL